MEEPEQDIREKLAGESGSCSQQSSRSEVAEGSRGSVATAVGTGPVMNRQLGQGLSPRTSYTNKQQPAVPGTNCRPLEHSFFLLTIL